MTRLLLCLALVLAVPADAQQKEKEQKQPQKKGAVSPEDLVRQADERKLAAGDSDAALDLLRRPVELGGPSGDAALRLGRLLESRFELDTAIDAYRDAAAKLSGAAKGEALARLSICQELRGSPYASTSAEAAAAADPAGTWPKIALSRARSRAGKADEALGGASTARGARASSCPRCSTGSRSGPRRPASVASGELPGVAAT